MNKIAYNGVVCNKLNKPLFLKLFDRFLLTSLYCSIMIKIYVDYIGDFMDIKSDFLRNFSKAIINRKAAIFAGAGLSSGSGCPSWKDLLDDLAKRIGLDVYKENDLTEVAQYIKNETGRVNINNAIANIVNNDIEINENIKILTMLPISTYRTTNYDNLLEEGLKEAHRHYDVKFKSIQIPIVKDDCEAVIYKMHGDASSSDTAVITKDDYAFYNTNYPLFREMLQISLATRTFLFIGFSFEDPNLEFILQQLRSNFSENSCLHYCFMKSIKVNKGDKDSEYNRIKQNLKEKELKRFGIQTIFVDEYSEITSLLNKLSLIFNFHFVFISGSISHYDETWPKDSIDDLAYKLARSLIKRNIKITSGFGLGIGSSVINGALDEFKSHKRGNIDDVLSLYPFPQGIADENERKNRWTSYRKEIIKKNKICIFISGNKIVDGEVANANGCIEEFNIAREYNCFIIPIGSTGYAAKEILDSVKKEISNYSYLAPYIDELANETNVENIIQIVLKIINDIENQIIGG